MHLTAFEERRLRWAPFIRELVGKGKLVGVTELVARFKCLRGVAPTLDEKVTRDERQALYLQISGKRAPNATNAWWLGESLKKSYPWCGGLLALYAAGHLPDFVGVLASLPAEEARAHAERISAMINTAYAATYENMLGMSYEKAIALKATGLIIPPASAIEIERLADRAHARQTWLTAYAGGLGLLINQAWTLWCAHRTKPRLSRFLGQAHHLASDRSFSFSERAKLLIRALQGWLHSEITPEPPELLFDSLDQYAFLNGLDATSARRARRLFLMQYLLEQETRDGDWFPGTLGTSPGASGRPAANAMSDKILSMRDLDEPFKER